MTEPTTQPDPASAPASPAASAAPAAAPAAASPAAGPAGAEPAPGLDLDRGELSDADLDGLEAAIDGVDFAARRADPGRLERLQALLARLQDVLEQFRAGIRRPRAERKPVSQEDQARCAQLVEEGIAAGERGDLAVAMTRLEEAVRLDPEGREGLFNLGVVYGLLAHHNVAKAEFYDDYTRDHVFAERAMRCYDRVLELDPEHVASLNNLATLYSMRDERDLALEVLRRLVALTPKDDQDRAVIDGARAQVAELESI